MSKLSTDPVLDAAARAALDCAQACRRCAAACLEEKDIAMLRECIRLDRDCAWICDLASAFLIGKSDFREQACQLCIDLCEACASECGKHEHMEHCKECAEACLRCAEACRALVGALA